MQTGLRVRPRNASLTTTDSPSHYSGQLVPVTVFSARTGQRRSSIAGARIDSFLSAGTHERSVQLEGCSEASFTKCGLAVFVIHDGQFNLFENVLIARRVKALLAPSGGDAILLVVEGLALGSKTQQLDVLVGMEWFLKNKEGNVVEKKLLVIILVDDNSGYFLFLKLKKFPF